MSQKAYIRNPESKRSKHRHELHCYRDGKLIMKLNISHTKLAERLKGYWDNGASQAEMAEVLKGKSMV